MPPAPPSLARRDLRTLVLASLGGALEFYDFIIFMFFANVIGQLFFPAETPEWLRQFQTFGLFAAGYLARPLGGILMAHFGDRDGRKRMFLLSVLLMALPTLAIGLMPTYATLGHAAPLALLLFRILQGAAIGGEVPGAWTFVAEHVPERHIGLACGAITAGLTGGILIGSLVASAVTHAITPEAVVAWGWRVPFVIGGLFGLLAMYLRRLLAETPIFEAMRRRRALAEGLPLRLVLAGHGRAVVVSMLLTWYLTAGVVVVILLTPTFLQNLFHIPAPVALAAGSVATFALNVGCVVFGHLADRFGARRALMGGAVLMATTMGLLYAGMEHAPQHLLPLYTLAGFCVGTTAAVPALLVRMFPANVRFSGVSFAYNIAYALAGGLTPLLLALLVQRSAFAPAGYVAIVSVVTIIVAAWLGSSELHRMEAPGEVAAAASS